MNERTGSEMNGMHRMLMAVVCTVLQICFGTVYAWSYFQSLMVQELGWSFTDTAWAFSTAIFSLGVSAAWAGAVLPRVGPRKLATIGSILFSVGYLVASLALHLEILLLFHVGYGLIGGAGIGMGYVTPVSTVAKWFPERKGLYTGIVVMGFGVGAFLMSKGLAPLLLVQTSGDLAMVFFWLGILFGAVLIPASLFLRNPPEDYSPATVKKATSVVSVPAFSGAESATVGECLRSTRFVMMWIVFFFNIAAGISIISFQSPLLAEVWGLADPSLEPVKLAEYGATLIAVSSLFNGLGRLFWGLLSDRIGRVKVFRILLGTQMIVFGILMTERNPWVFSALVCYVLFCFGGGFATMPSFILDVFGPKHMSPLYGAILTAWAAAGIIGPLYVGRLKDHYPDRAVIYCFLIGIFFLGLGYLFSYLLDNDPVRLGKPTLRRTLQEYGIKIPSFLEQEKLD
ncbi:OFA family MFS transporter [Verrucomicrobia bacterium]|nr:OFA family MFS transporter [Verrucomicrobiota bacterium]